jgi:hypothetical protein
MFARCYELIKILESGIKYKDPVVFTFKTNHKDYDEYSIDCLLTYSKMRGHKCTHNYTYTHYGDNGNIVSWHVLKFN